MLGLALLVGCEAPPPAPTPRERVASTHQLELKGVILDRWLGDRAEQRAFASRARVDRLASVAEVQDLTLDLLDPATGAREARVTAPRARGELEGQHFTLEGGVRVVDREGRILETKTAVYDARARTIVAPSFVTLTGDNFSTEGSSGELDLNRRLLTVGGPVKSIVREQSGASGPPRR